jgi:hypothetical protein
MVRILSDRLIPLLNSADNILQGSKFDALVTNFIIISDEDMNFEACVLTADRLVRIDKDGVRTELGKVDRGQFVATSTAECVVETLRLIKQAVSYAGGKAVKKRNK